jgi:hypothetical protein
VIIGAKQPVGGSFAQGLKFKMHPGIMDID